MTSPRTRPPQASAVMNQISALADRISELLPQAGDQALMLHWLTGYLGHSPEFTAAARRYLDKAQHRQAAKPGINGHGCDEPAATPDLPPGHNP
jgi:hypothetical protein